MYYYNDSEKWQKSCPDVFWGEIAPCEHIVQKVADSVMHICHTHSKIISSQKYTNELYYKTLDSNI